MPFENTPEDRETGDYGDATVAEETEEVWIDHNGKAYGFILIPQSEVPWRKKSEAVQNAINQRSGEFSAVDYYEEMLQYQVQETSFGAEERLKAWITQAPSDLLEQVEEHVPDPMGGGGEDRKAEVALELVEDYVANEGDTSDPLSAFESYLRSRVEGEAGK